MSIKSDVRELEALKKEIKLRSGKLRDLRQKAKRAEARILAYLKSKEQQGVKWKGQALYVESKESFKRKNKQLATDDALKVLRNAGVKHAETLLSQILATQKGEGYKNEKLKFKALK